MKKFSIFLVIALGLVFYLKSLTLAQAPVMGEQLVYSLNVYNGKGYGGAFTPQTEDTIYLIANKDSAISARITLVYFWPIAAKFMAAWQTLNEEVEGTLEILKEGKVIKSLKPQDNSLYYPQGLLGKTTVLRVNEDAHTYYEKYKKVTEEYYQKISEYYKTRTEYPKKMDEFLEEIKKRREAGEEFTSEEIERIMPKEPTPPPEGPKFHTTEPRKDYIINLPVGSYQIRIRAEDGTIIEDSQKNLAVFTSTRVGGIGYEIIRHNEWGKRETYSQSDKAIHQRGAKVLYFRPYYQNEYNELYYNKLEDPQSSGNIDQSRWFNMSPIKNVVLLLLKEGNEVERIQRKPYYVEQIGTTLRYNIIEHEKPYERPAFEGYKLNLSLRNPGEYEIVLLDKNSGKLIEQSRKQLKVVLEEASLFSSPEKTIETCFNAIVNKNLNLAFRCMTRKLRNDVQNQVQIGVWNMARDAKRLQNWKITEKELINDGYALIKVKSPQTAVWNLLKKYKEKWEIVVWEDNIEDLLRWYKQIYQDPLPRQVAERLQELKAEKQQKAPDIEAKVKVQETAKKEEAKMRYVTARVSNADDKAVMYVNGQEAISVTWGTGPRWQVHRPQTRRFWLGRYYPLSKDRR